MLLTVLVQLCPELRAPTIEIDPLRPSDVVGAVPDCELDRERSPRVQMVFDVFEHESGAGPVGPEVPIHGRGPVSIGTRVVLLATPVSRGAVRGQQVGASGPHTKTAGDYMFGTRPAADHVQRDHHIHVGVIGFQAEGPALANGHIDDFAHERPWSTRCRCEHHECREPSGHAHEPRDRPPSPTSRFSSGRRVAHIRSGAGMPSSPRPVVSSRRAASTSRSGGTAKRRTIGVRSLPASSAETVPSWCGSARKSVWARLRLATLRA